MEKYLSIGEVSKIKGVSVKSLRYYAELGILIPAYINPQSGYRYYSIEQMTIIDLIFICIELNIPLKNFNSYTTKDGLLNLEKMLIQGKKNIEQNIAKLNITVKNIENISRHIENSHIIKSYSSDYNRFFDERYVIVKEWDNNVFDMCSFIECMSAFNILCNRFNLTWLNQGTLHFKENSQIKNMFSMEVAKPEIKLDNIIKLSQANYKCQVFLNDAIDIAVKENIENKNYPDGTIILFLDLYDKKMDSKNEFVEMQLFIPQ